MFSSAHQDAIIVVECRHKMQSAGVSTESKGSYLAENASQSSVECISAQDKCRVRSQRLIERSLAI